MIRIYLQVRSMENSIYLSILWILRILKVPYQTTLNRIGTLSAGAYTIVHPTIPWYTSCLIPCEDRCHWTHKHLRSLSLDWVLPHRSSQGIWRIFQRLDYEIQINPQALFQTFGWSRFGSWNPLIWWLPSRKLTTYPRKKGKSSTQKCGTGRGYVSSQEGNRILYNPYHLWDWCIYLHLVDFCLANVAEYTMHGWWLMMFMVGQNQGKQMSHEKNPKDHSARPESLGRFSASVTTSTPRSEALVEHPQRPEGTNVKRWGVWPVVWSVEKKTRHPKSHTIHGTGIFTYLVRSIFGNYHWSRKNVWYICMVYLPTWKPYPKNPYPSRFE